MKKILITGGSGLLGSNLAIRLCKKYKVSILVNKKKISIPNTLSIDGDLFFKNSYDEFKPDLIINTVALTNIELCEKDPISALEINLNYVKSLISLCNERKCKLLHISTDHLSNGSKPFRKENDILEPLNEYARTKLEADNYIQDRMPTSIIIRTNFFGWGTSYRNSFSDRIIFETTQRRKLFLFENAFFSPVSIRRLCEILIKLYEKNASGIYNVSSNDRISKFNFGLNICNNFKLDKKLIIPSSIEDNKCLVNRPKDTSLNNQKVSNFLKYDCGFVSNNINDLNYDIKDGIRNKLIKL